MRTKRVMLEQCLSNAINKEIEVGNNVGSNQGIDVGIDGVKNRGSQEPTKQSTETGNGVLLVEVPFIKQEKDSMSQRDGDKAPPPVPRPPSQPVTADEVFPLTPKEWMQCLSSRNGISDALVIWEEMIEGIENEKGREHLLSMKKSRLQVMFATKQYRAQNPR